MRVLFVLEHFHPYIGGVETLFASLAANMVNNGHHVSVVTTRHDPDLPTFELWNGIEIYRVHCYNRYLFSFFSLFKIMRLVRSHDVIQTTSYNAALPAWIGGVVSRKPVIITFHEVWRRLWWRLPYIPFHLRLAYYVWERLILFLPFTRIVAVSESTRRDILATHISPNKVIKIYNGLDQTIFNDFQHAPPDRFTFTYVGRLGYSKGLDILIPAALIFLKKHPNAVFRCIIPPYPRAFYQRILNSLASIQDSDNLELYHDLDSSHLFHLMRSSSCIVIPSYSEGFCFVAAEASMMDIPVVSSGRGALEEVPYGRVLTMPSLDRDGLLLALEAAMMNRWSMIKPSQFSLEVAVEKYISLYKEVL